MAKRQRKTPQSRYRLRKYNEYKVALKFYGINIKELKRPTRQSIENARKIWRQETRKFKAQAKEQGIDYKDIVPTLKEAYKFEREHPQSTEPMATHNETRLNISYIRLCADAIYNVTPIDRPSMSARQSEHYWNRFREYQQQIEDIIEKTIDQLTAYQNELDAINSKLELGQYDNASFNELQNRHEHIKSNVDAIIHNYETNQILERIKDLAEYYIEDAVEHIEQSNIIAELRSILQNGTV